MKYIDIQLTDKELWEQFQAKYQAGEYADALALLQKPNQNNEAYVWEKYDISGSYVVSETVISENGMGKNPVMPDDADLSVKYTAYELNSETGVFTLLEPDENAGSPLYYPSPSPNKIYAAFDSGTHGSYVDIYKWAVYSYESVVGDPVKGSTYYGTVISEDEAAYPANGEQDGYWYVLVGEATVGGYSGYKGLIAEALNTLTDYIVWVENPHGSTFNTDKPPVQANQPTQTTGQLWFQVTN